MPAGDGTGPNGDGARTGRGKGYCPPRRRLLRRPLRRNRRRSYGRGRNKRN